MGSEVRCLYSRARKLYTYYTCYTCCKYLERYRITRGKTRCADSHTLPEQMRHSRSIHPRRNDARRASGNLLPPPSAQERIITGWSGRQHLIRPYLSVSTVHASDISTTTLLSGSIHDKQTLPGNYEGQVMISCALWSWCIPLLLAGRAPHG